MTVCAHNNYNALTNKQHERLINKTCLRMNTKADKKFLH